ncbi:uncharacterized protein M437DRAFT_61031 [Aureobasidium melanogenum CBS 110374]|uniref:HTH psq-type domain-containing protein n=1 Tax=Aureobasidium melanogenum (strain CBS 110374) TaxID=1043003 RepID=A0A074VAS3_AURM1|nr:uncharacterized protein M437DRAFT_61031 [Aureobasidium melanogenum CBS 110374]KEQ57740.1 hypothetical protein M437DRAFT_61031 [Aureobasidium melanogenum CBS 110374]
MLQELNVGLCASIRAAGHAHNVPERSIRPRLAKRQDSRTAYAHEQRLQLRREEY